MRRPLTLLTLALALAGCPTPDGGAARGEPPPPDAAAEGAALAAKVRALQEGHTDRDDEKGLERLLRAASPGGLDHALGELDLGDLLSDVDDRVFGPDGRTALLELLGARAADLSVTNRAGLIDALQAGSTDDAAEATVVALFEATTGAGLTRLKNAVDGGDGHRDLVQLVFHDLDDAGRREALLAHFAAAAEPAGELKVLSDIDDTVYANWKDERFPGGTRYPGVVAFYRELDRGPGPEPGREGDFVFVTARPGDRPGLVEGATRETLAGLGFEACVVLAGDLSSLAGNDAIAARKLENFLAYARIFPEYGFVFVGDSGQGDAAFGAGMLAERPEAVRVVLIHEVVPVPEGEREEGVLYFETYVEAARLAHARDLIETAGLVRVARAAVDDLAGVDFDDPEQEAARRAELARDLEAVSALLPAGERVELGDR